MLKDNQDYLKYYKLTKVINMPQVSKSMMEKCQKQQK